MAGNPDALHAEVDKYGSNLALLPLFFTRPELFSSKWQGEPSSSIKLDFPDPYQPRSPVGQMPQRYQMPQQGRLQMPNQRVAMPYQKTETQE